MRYLVTPILILVCSASLLQSLNTEAALQDDSLSVIEHLSNIPDMPSAIGAYSVGVKVHHGDYSTLYAAGQIGLNPETGDLISDQVDE